MLPFCPSFPLVSPSEFLCCVGHLLIIKRVDPMTHLIPICVITSLTFLISFITLNSIQRTKCDKLLRSFQKTGSKLSAEDRFTIATDMSRAYASMVVTAYYGISFYLFAQEFMARYDPITYVHTFHAFL